MYVYIVKPLMVDILKKRRASLQRTQLEVTKVVTPYKSTLNIPKRTVPLERTKRLPKVFFIRTFPCVYTHTNSTVDRILQSMPAGPLGIRGIGKVTDDKLCLNRYGQEKPWECH